MNDKRSYSSELLPATVKVLWKTKGNEVLLIEQLTEVENEIKKFVEHRLGGWPIAQESANENKLDLIDFHRKLSEKGYAIDGLIHISTILNFFNSFMNNRKRMQ